MKFVRDSDLRKVPRLRWRRDADDTIIARCRKRRLAKDHLYFHAPGVLGIYYSRPTRRLAGKARQFWEEQVRPNLLPPLQIGDWDGIILFRAESEEAVPALFIKGRAPANSFAKLAGK